MNKVKQLLENLLKNNIRLMELTSGNFDLEKIKSEYGALPYFAGLFINDVDYSIPSNTEQLIVIIRERIIKLNNDELEALTTILAELEKKIDANEIEPALPLKYPVDAQPYDDRGAINTIVDTIKSYTDITTKEQFKLLSLLVSEYMLEGNPFEDLRKYAAVASEFANIQEKNPDFMATNSIYGTVKAYNVSFNGYVPSKVSSLENATEGESIDRVSFKDTVYLHEAIVVAVKDGRLNITDPYRSIYNLLIVVQGVQFELKAYEPKIAFLEYVLGKIERMETSNLACPILYSKAVNMVIGMSKGLKRAYGGV